MKSLILLLALSIMQVTYSQNTLPDFSVSTRGKGKIIISWNNAYPVIKQISIQRSPDSLKNYRTIITVPDPHVAQNGFVDTKAQTDFQYYRLFILLDSAKYFFTKGKRPFWDTAYVTSVKQETDKNNEVINRLIAEYEKQESLNNSNKTKEIARNIVIYKKDSIVRQLSEKDLRSFRDSLFKTKDTLLVMTKDTFLIKPFIAKEVYRPSRYIFTAADGNVTISLPDAGIKKYHIKFFEENLTLLFEIREVKESPLTLDKANFLHGGWFRFELYENGLLKEKQKFFIPKDF